MNFFEKIVSACSFKVSEPTFLSPFHLIAFAIMVGATVGVSFWFTKCKTDKPVRIFIFACWIVLIIGEIVKEILLSYSVRNNTWNYNWEHFPFQLCSSPLYVLPFLVFLKEGKVRDAFLAFLCSFSLFGGLVVMIYPGSVFVDLALINTQSMLHHGIQCILGISLAIFYRKKITWKFFLTGLIVYAGMISIAQLLNAIVPCFTTDKFNMFYISWQCPCELPLLSIFYEKTPYLAFFLIYLFGFVVAASVVFVIIWGILRLVNFVKNRTAKNSAQGEE